MDYDEIDALGPLEEAINELLQNAVTAAEPEYTLVNTVDIKLLQRAFDEFLRDEYGNIADKF